MKLKKLTVAILAIALTATSIPSVTAEEYLSVSDVMKTAGTVSEVNAGEESPAEDFYYSVNEDEESVTITGYRGDGGDVVIPAEIEGKKVTDIDDWAFSNCTSVTSIYIPDSVTIIWFNMMNGAFNGCTSLTAINVSENNKRYLSKDGVLFSKGETASTLTLLRYPEGKEDKNYFIPDNVTWINPSSFRNCTFLKSIEIPDSVTTIGGYDEFYGCSSLTAINVAEKNKNYSSKDGVLFDKNMSKLIKYPEGKTDNSYVIPENVTWVNSYAFYNISTLISVEIPKSVEKIGSSAFESCTELKSVTIPNSVTSLGDSAFSGCTALRSAVISNGLTSIGGYWIFSGCISLTSIEIPNGVTSIGYGAFSGCTSLLSVEIPNSVTSIGGSAFFDCTSLSSVEIPNSVTEIGGFAFEFCSSLASIEIPGSVTSIGNDAFSSCTSLAAINVSEDNQDYSSMNGVLFDKNKTELILYPEGKEDTSYIIPNSVTNIGDNSFSGCASLKSVVIPNSVEKIGYSAFEACTALKSVDISNSVKSIGCRAFSGCTSLTSIDISDGVTAIGDGLFYNCTSLVYVVIPKSVTSMLIVGYEEIGMFYNCPKHLIIYGYTDSFAERQANRMNITFVPIDDNASIQVNTGVAVMVPDNSIVTLENKILEVTRGESTETSAIYNITLKNEKGNEVQPDGEVTVKISVPAGINGEESYVYRTEGNDEYTDMKAVYKDGCMVFTTDHFSEYIISTEKLITVTLADLNNDGKITTVDAKWVLQAVSGSRTLTPEQEAAADVNGDGKITTVDAKWILQVVSGSRVL